MIVDKIYQRRFSDTEKRQVLWSILVNDFFQKLISSKDTVLDIPCGYGEFINNIVCANKYAIDINPDSKTFLNKDIKFLKASSTKIPLQNKSIDKVFVSNFFEHINHEDIEKTVLEVKRILKDGGNIMILQPNIRFASKNYWMFFDHITPIDDRALEEIFIIHGFKLKKRILKFLPFSTQSKYPIIPFLVKLYIHMPLVWKIFGQQTFMVFEK